jgi:hypothetical protein
VRISTIITTVILSVLPAAAATRDGPVTPFELLDDGSIVLAVTIGGTGPYRFVLDTGSSRTVISTRLWRSLHLPVIALTRMVTPAGGDLAYVVRLSGFAIGEGPGVGIAAAVMSADRYAAGQQVDGLIGQDVLARSVYTIDYQHRAIVWHADGDALPGVRLPLSVRDNRVLVTLPQFDGDPHPLSLIPDTGTDGLVLFAQAQHRLRMTLLDVGMLSSVSGSRLVRRACVDGLVVGDALVRDPDAVLLDDVDSDRLMGDGLLPLHVFARVTFNVREQYLIVHVR